MSSNISDSSSGFREHNLPALIFGILLITAIICGNLLVCLSVYKEKALKTTTNYFIVSLAVADLLLAVLVLPLFVFTEFQGGVWSLNMVVCDWLMAMDVMLCTASIFNLCAISIDRFIAVSIPLNYNRKHVDQRQILLLSATWLLAFAVASPVIFGINQVPHRDPAACRLEDENYIVYSSVCSFFIPCPIMLLLYCGIFHGLRRWEEARKAKLRNSIQACRKLQHSALPPRALPRVVQQDLALPRVVQQDLALPRVVQQDLALPPSTLPPSALHRVVQQDLALPRVIQQDLALPRVVQQDLALPRVVQQDLALPRVIQQDLAQSSMDDLDDDMQPSCPLPPEYNNSSIQTVAYTELQNSGQRRKRAKINGRERKAMRVLPVVVGTFLFCWTPFFVVHTTRALCGSCDISPHLTSTVTWLGYLNSALNPIIYTVFNTEFRKFFHKFLHSCC